MDTDDATVLDEALDAWVDELNAALPESIKAKGYDPLKTVASGTDTLGKINLGLCKASVKASYSITDLRDLSSLQISAAAVTSVDGVDTADDQRSGTLNGTLTFTADIGSGLSADIGGSVKASACGVSLKAGISGSAKASGVTATGTASFSASRVDGKFVVDDVTFDKPHVDYGKISIHVNGLGDLNQFLDELEDLIEDVFGSYLTNELAAILRDLLNSVAHDLG